MVSELGGLNLNATTYQAVMGAATTLINTANNSLTNLQTSVGVMQENVKHANSALSLQSNVLTTQIGNFENVNATMSPRRFPRCRRSSRPPIR